jgi:cytochrome c-type biogenesis protein
VRFAVLTLLLLVGSLALAGPASAEYGEIGTEVPDYTARSMGDSEDFSTRDARGDALLINVWATWCVPCRKEMPELQELSERYEGELRVVGVSIDDEGYDGEVTSFTDNLGVTFDLARDEDRKVVRAFRTAGVPETILVDPDGTVAYRWRGPLENDDVTRRTIERAIAGEGDYVETAEEDARAGAGGILTAMLAGLLSFLSPCVLPLIPSYAAFLAGGASEPRKRRRRVLTNGLCFVAGFSLIFVLLGIAASIAGGALFAVMPWLARAGGALLIVLGIAMLGLLPLKVLKQERRMLDKIVSRVGHGPGPSFAVGGAFAAGWTPCIGPVLAGILTLAATTGDVVRGATLLLAYSIGLAVPLLATALAVAVVPSRNARLRRLAPIANAAAAVLLIVVGVLLVTDSMTRLAAWTAEFVNLEGGG